MHIRFRSLALVAAAALALAAAPARAADTYKTDPAHTWVIFVVSHLGISPATGLFTDSEGSFVYDQENPSASKFDVTIRAASVSTGQPKRDAHLKSPDFFNVKEFPDIRFKSTLVAAGEGGLKVTGDLSLHGETKPITVLIKKGGEADWPKGQHRLSINTEFTIKRSEYGMKSMQDVVGDEVKLTVVIEGVRQ